MECPLQTRCAGPECDGKASNRCNIGLVCCDMMEHLIMECRLQTRCAGPKCDGKASNRCNIGLACFISPVLG